jgi:hypothetical protein
MSMGILGFLLSYSILSAWYDTICASKGIFGRPLIVHGNFLLSIFSSPIFSYFMTTYSCTFVCVSNNNNVSGYCPRKSVVLQFVDSYFWVSIGWNGTAWRKRDRPCDWHISFALHMLLHFNFVFTTNVSKRRMPLLIISKLIKVMKFFLVC